MKSEISKLLTGCAGRVQQCWWPLNMGSEKSLVQKNLKKKRLYCVFWGLSYWGWIKGESISNDSLLIFIFIVNFNNLYDYWGSVCHCTLYGTNLVTWSPGYGTSMRKITLFLHPHCCIFDCCVPNTLLIIVLSYKLVQ